MRELIAQFAFIRISNQSKFVIQIQRSRKQQTQLIDKREIVFQHCKRINREQRRNNGQIRLARDMLCQNITDLISFVIYNYIVCPDLPGRCNLVCA